MLGRLMHVVENMNEKGRWLEAIGETPNHYLVLLRNAGDGVSSHVHAVPKKDFTVEGAAPAKVVVDTGADLV